MLALAVGASLALAQPDGDAIEWGSSRPLSWSDFRGAVPADAAPRTAALTSASISLGYSVEVRRDRRCVFELTSVETGAFFHPEQSWVRDGARTSLVLEHEQGHFDLTQVFRTIMEREADALVGEARNCPAGAADDAVQERAADIVGRIRERVWDDLARVQADYDAETGHGTLPLAQREWTTRIREALSSGRW